MENLKITVQATVLADIKKTWDYYTQPEHITKWNFASDDWHCPWAKNNLTVGGKYVSRMEAKDGSFGFDLEAIYTEVLDKQILTSVLIDNRVINVYFKPFENNTEVTITFDAETEHALEMQREGWQAILNNFKKYTESN